jgi:hypothetical protein
MRMNRRAFLLSAALAPAWARQARPARPVPQSGPARTGQTANLASFGADPAGRRDSTEAIEAALRSLPAGGTLVVPAGTYLVGRTIRIQSAITIAGEGTASVIRPSPRFDPAKPYGYYLFTNAGNPALQRETPQPPVGTVLDRDISFRGIRFDGAPMPHGPAGGITPVALRCVQGASFSDVEAHATASLAAMIGCRDYSFDRCRAYDVAGAAFDNWAGARNVSITNSFADPRVGWPGANAVQFNGQPGFPSVCSGLVVDRCDFRCGISLDTLASECSAENITIMNTTIEQIRDAVIGIIARGAISNLAIRNCRISGGGRGHPSIWVDQGSSAGKYRGDPRHIVIVGNRIDSRQQPPAANVIRVYCPPGADVTVADNTVTGNFGTALNLNGGTARGKGNRFGRGNVVTMHGSLRAQ